MLNRDQKKTARDATGFYAFKDFFLRLEIGQFSPSFELVSVQNFHSEPGEKGENPLEKTQKNPVETAHRNCRFLSLVVVDVLIKDVKVRVSHTLAQKKLNILSIFNFSSV